MMRFAVVDQRNRPGIDGRTVQLRLSHSSALTLRVRDVDLIPRLAEPPGDREARPRRRNARLDLEGIAPTPEAQDALEARAIHPSRGAGVPGPAATPRMGGMRVDVPRQD